MLTGRDDLGPDTIPEDEPVFVIRAKDKLAPGVLAFYATRARHLGCAPEFVASVERHAEAMVKYQKKNGSKLPDLPRDEPEE